MSAALRNLSIGTAWLVFFSACAESKQAALAACDREDCEDACLDLAGPECDVLRGDCQQRIFDAVRCVRGSDGKLPEIRTLTEEQVRAEREGDAGVDGGSEAADGGADISSDAGTATDSEADLAHWDTALRLLNLRVPMTATDSVDYLGGYYSSEDQRITLVDRGEAQDTSGAQRLMAHELVHALQDQQVGLPELRHNTGDTTDAMLAISCLTEGDANLYEELAWTLLQGLSVDPDYWWASFDRSFKYNRDAVLAADSPYDQLWLLRYAVGARYLAEAWLDGGNWAVQSLYDAPPISTVYWMRGFGDSGERMQPLSETLDCNLAATPKGFEQKWGDTLGAFTLFAFLGHNLTDDGVYQAERSWQRARTWRQDRFAVFGNAEGDTALSWRIRFLERSVAGEVAEELREQAALNLRVKQHGAELEIFASDSPQALKTWQGTDPARCPTVD